MADHCLTTWKAAHFIQFLTFSDGKVNQIIILCESVVILKHIAFTEV